MARLAVMLSLAGGLSPARCPGQAYDLTPQEHKNIQAQFWPFAPRSVAALRTCTNQITGYTNLVFAHYWLHYVSWENGQPETDWWAQYMYSDTNQPLYKDIGGKSRHRQFPRPVIDESSDSVWRYYDAATQIKLAIAMGLDGFAMGFNDNDPTHVVGAQQSPHGRGHQSGSRIQNGAHAGH